MAGIGFALRGLLDRRTLVSSTQAYLYAGVVSSGPWIISILSIAILNLFLRGYLGEAERNLFSTTVTHAYALALILTGPLQFVLSRQSADDLYARRSDRLWPVCVSALVLAGGVALIAGSVLFGGFVEEPLLYKWGAVTLLANVAMIFVTTNYLGTLRQFHGVVGSFVLGYLASCILAWAAARLGGVAAAVFAFSLGHACLLVCLLVLLRRELDDGDASPDAASLWRALRKFAGLAGCGLLYNLGIWIDKILFWWFSASAVPISGVLRAAPAYDLAIYLSFLSIVPGFSVFFLCLETRFAEAFRRFFVLCNQRGTLQQIEEAKGTMISSLQSGFGLLVAVQGAVTLTLLAGSNALADLVGIGALQLGIFRITLIGAFLLILFLSLLTILFYLDDRKGALWSAALFCFGNALLSGATLLAYEAWYGFGFVAAAAAATFFAVLRVNARMERFEHQVFAPNAF